MSAEYIYIWNICDTVGAGHPVVLHSCANRATAECLARAEITSQQEVLGAEVPTEKETRWGTSTVWVRRKKLITD